MNALLDTLAFATRSESAGFSHDQAPVPVTTYGQAQDCIRERLVTKADFNLSLAEPKKRLDKQFSNFESRMNKQPCDLGVRLTRDVGKNVTEWLWLAIIIGGVSIAAAAAISASVALLRVGALS